MRIGARVVGRGQPPLRVAAAGTAHGGDVQLGYRLAETAGAAGAEAVVFARGSLSERDFKSVLGHVRHIGLSAIGVITSEDDVALLEAMDVEALRVAEAEPAPLLDRASRTGRPLVLSLRRAGGEEASRVIHACRKAGCGSVALLTSDPRMIAEWQHAWPDVPVGLVTERPEAPAAAGAAIIETEHRLPTAPGRNRS